MAFEEGMKRLGEIVARLEEGDLPLAESVALYEEGVKLSAGCKQELDRAKLKLVDETGEQVE